MGLGYDVHLTQSQLGFGPSLMHLVSLATLKSCDKRKQSLRGWIYIWFVKHSLCNFIFKDVSVHFFTLSYKGSIITIKYLSLHLILIIFRSSMVSSIASKYQNLLTKYSYVI